MKKISKNKILIVLITFITSSLFSQKVKTLDVIYDQSFENMKYSFQRHLDLNKMDKILKKIKTNSIYIKSQSSAPFTHDYAGKEYKLEGDKNNYCNSCKQIEELIQSNLDKSLNTALFINSKSDVNFSQCGWKNDVINSIEGDVNIIDIGEGYDVVKNIYNKVKKKAKNRKKDYGIIIWQPGINFKGIDFTLNGYFENEVAVNFGDKVELVINNVSKGEKYFVEVNGERTNLSANSNGTITHSLTFQSDAKVKVSNGICSSETFVRVSNSCIECSYENPFVIDFNNNQFAEDKTDDSPHVKYEIKKDPLNGNSIYLFPIKLDRCIESYELELKISYVGDEDYPGYKSRKKLDGKKKVVQITKSSSPTNNKSIILYQVGSADLSIAGEKIDGTDLKVDIRIIPKKCFSGKNFKGNLSEIKFIPVRFARCN